MGGAINVQVTWTVAFTAIGPSGVFNVPTDSGFIGKDVLV